MAIQSSGGIAMNDVTKAIKDKMEHMSGIYSQFSIKPVTVAEGADDYFLVGNRNLSGTHKEMITAYAHLKKDVFDKIPQSVTKQWFFDNGFIEG